jgi:hypothetical protein
MHGGAAAMAAAAAGGMRGGAISTLGSGLPPNQNLRGEIIQYTPSGVLIFCVLVTMHMHTDLRHSSYQLLIPDTAPLHHHNTVTP